MVKSITTPISSNNNCYYISNPGKQKENYECFYHRNMTDDFAWTEMTFDDFSSLIRRVQFN